MFCSLNTGLTSFLNFGNQVSMMQYFSYIMYILQLLTAVSIITVAHEIGHNFGSPVSTLHLVVLVIQIK